MIAIRSTSLVPVAAIALIAWLGVSSGFAKQAADIDQVERSDKPSSEIQPPSVPISPRAKGQIENVPSRPDGKPLGQIAAPQSPKQQARLPQTKGERDLCEAIRAKRRAAIRGLDCSRSQLDSLHTQELSPEQALARDQPGNDALAGQDIPTPDKSIPPIVIIAH